MTIDKLLFFNTLKRLNFTLTKGLPVPFCSEGRFILWKQLLKLADINIE